MICALLSTPFALLFWRNNIFRVCIKPGGSLNITIFGVQLLNQGCSRTIKSQQLFAIGGSYGETFDVFPRFVILGIWKLALI